MPPLPCSTRWTRRRSLRLWLGFPDESLDVLVRRGGVPSAETVTSASFIGGSFWRRDGGARPAGWGGRAGASVEPTGRWLAGRVPGNPLPRLTGQEHVCRAPSAVGDSCWSSGPAETLGTLSSGRPALTMLRSSSKWSQIHRTAPSALRPRRLRAADYVDRPEMAWQTHRPTLRLAADKPKFNGRIAIDRCRRCGIG